MLYHEREGKNKENANFVHIVYLLAKLCNAFIDVSICTYIQTCFTCVVNINHTYIQNIHARMKIKVVVLFHLKIVSIIL